MLAGRDRRELRHNAKRGRLSGRNLTLERAEPDAPLRLMLKGGGSVDGSYVRHDARVIVLRVDGEEQAIQRSGVEDVLLYIVTA